MMGYWENPGETAKVLRPGRYPGERMLYTGDLFKTDEDGYLYFVARKDDIIKSRGEKVSPKEVENVIYELPEILEVSIVGVQDDVLGQAVKAKIVLKNGPDSLTERQVIAHCMQNMERFMVPKYVEFVSSLPKTASGKIMKREVEPDE
jgi:acyl-CoA synthetase (AMP-forming)/AMP-acid ligase II